MKTKNQMQVPSLLQDYNSLMITVNETMWPVYYQIRNHKEVHLPAHGGRPMVNVIEAVAKTIDEIEFSNSLILAYKLEWYYTVEQAREVHSGEVRFESIIDVNDLPFFLHPKFSNQQVELK